MRETSDTEQKEPSHEVCTPVGHKWEQGDKRWPVTLTGLWEGFTEKGLSERTLKDKEDFEMVLNSSTSNRFTKTKYSIKLYLHFYSG